MKLPDRFHLIEHAELDSTNSEALRLAGEGAADGTVIWAHVQTGGRGRHGRTWQSLTGNLAVSFLLRPDAPMARLPELSLLAAVALSDALELLLSRSAGLALKWPNDVLVGGAKLAGILLESAGDGAVAIGIGVNVASCPDPHSLAYPATCLTDHARSVTVAALLEALASALDIRLACWRTEGFAPVLADWMERGPRQGEEVRVRTGAETIIGLYHGLSPEGALLLDTPAGLRRVTAGDVLPLAA